MEHGDDELRVLTEIDDVTKKRHVKRFNAGGQESAILIDKEGHRARWDFTIENPMYGKLVCSYYPEDAQQQIQGYFRSGFAEEKDGKRSVPAIPMWSCTASGMKYLQEQIQQAIHNALAGLVMEAQVHGLRDCNGDYFIIPNLDLKKQVGQIRKFYKAHANNRLGAHQGQQRDKAGFLLRTYKAYCEAVADLESRGEPVEVTEEKLVTHLTYKRKHKKAEQIDARSFTKLMSSYGFTYEKLLERFEYSRNREPQLASEV
jgi:hypothetical protein